MKKVLLFLMALTLCFTLSVTALGWSDTPLLVDDAQLLSPGEQADLLATLEEISNRQQMDIVVVTTDSTNGDSPMVYADDFYDYNGYAPDGVLLLISMEDSDWYVSTTGYGISAVTDAGLDFMSDRFVPHLSSGDFYKAFTTYATLCDEFITQAQTGDPYDVGNLPKGDFPLLLLLCLSLIIGLVVALIATGVMKNKLKSVRFQPTATQYVKQGSMNITHATDLFLFSRVTRTAKPQNNGSSTHRSSSGRSHGGGGGKF